MDLTVFIAVLFALQLVCLFIGSRAARKITTQDDYYLAGRGIGFFPLLMTFIATQIGGGMILGATEEAYQYGWYILLYPLGCCLGLSLLAMGLGQRIYQFKVSTIAQIFEVVYRSPGLKKAASSLSILSLFMIFVGQVIASKKFMLSIGFNQDYIFAAFWALVIIYTVMGGLRAVVDTDIVQALFFILVFGICFGFILMTQAIPIRETIQSGLNTESFTFNSEKFCGWLLMPLLFMVIEQDMGQRCFAAKSGKALAWAAGAAAVCCMVICIVPIYLGILGKTAGVVVAEGSSVLMTVSQAVSTPTLAAFMGCAVLAAIISTADSLINAISSNLTQDFNLPLGNKKVLVSQAITAAIALAGIVVSYSFNSVVDMLILSYELSISCLFVSVFAAIVGCKGNKTSALLSIVLGGVGFVIFRIYPIWIPKEIASLLLSSGGYLAGEYAVVRMKKAVMD